MSYDGLNLTRASLDGQLKYKTAYSPGAPKFYFLEDQDTVLWASDGSYPGPDSQSFECQIMDWADNIAYAVHDLEDGIHAGFVTAAVLADGGLIIDVMDRAFQKLSGKVPSLTADHIQECWAALDQELRRLDGPLSAVGNHQQRKQYRKMLTSDLIGRFIQSTDRVERPGARGNINSERYLYEVDILTRGRMEVTLVNSLVWRAVMRSPQVMTLEAKARQLVRALFLRHMEGDGFYLLPEDWRQICPLQSSAVGRARVVADYLSGMTDDYTQKLYSRLFLPNHGTVFDQL
jgi:dGTPase